mgnify:FL=1|tara:strand:+ start:537 stop:746 length:210 start_codon:yes stop_codon:yes gene_type:complete
MDKWKKYWAYSGERAIKTVAQTAIATITASGVIGILQIDVMQLLSVSALSGLMSLLTSVLAYDKEPKNG